MFFYFSDAKQALSLQRCYKNRLDVLLTEHKKHIKVKNASHARSKALSLLFLFLIKKNANRPQPFLGPWPIPKKNANRPHPRSVAYSKKTRICHSPSCLHLRASFHAYNADRKKRLAVYRSAGSIRPAWGAAV